MSEIGTLGILDEIQALVCDKLQVVSYKWLSRNFLVSSNAAKSLLQEFVEKHGTGLGVVYSLSGWLKNNPSTYHIRLISKPKLEETKLEFDDNCSVQVYSVQACIPKDPAALWNAEFIQAEELCKQPNTIDNCLRDNRFCGVSNSFVKWNARATPVSTATPPVKSGGLGLSKSDSAQKSATFAQTQQKTFQQPSPAVSLQSPHVANDVKSENRGQEGHAQESKPALGTEKLPHLLVNKNKGQTDLNLKSSGSGGALANMWGRASVKSKPDNALEETRNAIPNSAASAEAQICAREALEYGSSDEEGQHVNFKRTSKGEGNRKRRVVYDFSDEEDEFVDAVNLASPDLPKKQSALASKPSTNISELEKNNQSLEKEKEDKPEDKERKQLERKVNQSLREESQAASNGKKSETSTKKFLIHVPETHADIKDKVADAAPISPKRRKVLKT